MDYKMINLPRYFFSAFLISIVVLTIGCSTSEKTTQDQSDVEPSDNTMVDKNLTDLQTMLAENRSKLSDVHGSLNHDMPEVFLKQDSSDASLNSDPFDGYRVQIISTKNRALADTVANKFRSWADTTVQGYNPRAYVFFKQPFYKVHIGDFQQREQANSFSRLIKRRYSDAWVVHDRINPTNVPADTASFYLGKPKTPNTSD